ncbi:MAG: Flp pilus assembly protein CpaB [Litorimonas sp.]
MDRRRIVLIAAMVVLMGVVFIGLRGLGGGGAPAEPTIQTIVEEVDYTQVLSVTEPMSKGSRVQPGDLNWIDWPTEALTPALIIDDPEAEVPVIDSLVGALVREPLQPGEPLVMTRFIRAGDAGIMAALLRPGMRAVTVRISVDTASGGFIQPGDKVDIILQESLDDLSGGDTRIIASTIFENVTVLAIDQIFSTSPEGGAAVPGSTATLELSPRDAERVTVAQVKGDLSLVLRGFSDSDAWAPTRASDLSDTDRAIPPVAIYRRGAAQSIAVRGN